MKRKLLLWQLSGFAVTSFLGTLLHFLYEWTDNSILVAPFSGVNESTWEHMKLIFWPMLLFAIVESFFFKDQNDFYSIKLKGILLGIFLIPLIFYMSNGIFGKTPDSFNIAIFFISALSAYIYEAHLLKKERKNYLSNKSAVLLLLLIALSFIFFTFFPPEIALFEDPLTGGYGI